MYSASAFAANTMARSAVGAAFPLFTTQMYEGMGVNWASTLIGGVALLLLPIPFLFYKYGPRIRARSKFAPSRVCSPYDAVSLRRLTSPDHRTSRSQKRLRRNARPWKKTDKYRIRHCFAWSFVYPRRINHTHSQPYTRCSYYSTDGHDGNNIDLDIDSKVK